MVPWYWEVLFISIYFPRSNNISNELWAELGFRYCHGTQWYCINERGAPWEAMMGLRLWLLTATNVVLIDSGGPSPHCVRLLWSSPRIHSSHININIINYHTSSHNYTFSLYYEEKVCKDIYLRIFLIVTYFLTDHVENSFFIPFLSSRILFILDLDTQPSR